MPKRLTPGVNDLATLFPKVAEEADGWDPSTVTSKANKNRDWKCKLGHTYEALVSNRSNGSGCPYCAGKKAWPGFNDVESRFPELAAQAVGWDPTQFTYGSKEKVYWKCALGHTWEARIESRSGKNKTGCPFCSGNDVWPGFNDLETKFPEIAAEAHGWNPTEFTHGSKKRKDWICDQGHIYDAPISQRTSTGSGCPICCNQKVLAGFNDLATTHPKDAVLAHEWDTSKVTAKSSKSKKWKCSHGHIYTAKVYTKTNGHGCSVCSGRTVLEGFNDLKSFSNKVAARADGWDPSKVTFGSGKKMNWICDKGHKYKQRVYGAIKYGCPVCAGQEIQSGVNDLATTHPALAKEAHGWDPCKFMAGSDYRALWRCEKGHEWQTSISNRGILGTRCPDCFGGGGFNQNLEAWMYLMERPGEQQIGISNVIDQRLGTHRRNGWQEIQVIGPRDGGEILSTETAIRNWLKKNIRTTENTYENWSTRHLEVRSLPELFIRTKIIPAFSLEEN
ncbi:zinc-ribbon domain-containing protein [Synechococcus sp. AH-551-A10]|nr:zinc-ribbon domain-containing protein [Synechococcus sp. AH-551-A10]MDB4682423.1 zinc-ribbon domain-containing protein [Synechococcus sp. AH-551-A10]